MIDVDTTWQQACAALASDEYDTAFGVLESAMREARPPVRARIALHLASAQALYGDPGVPDVRKALNVAVALDPALAADPLRRALDAELAARTQGEEAPPVPEELRTDPSALVRFHILCALALSGHPQDALDLGLTPAELPEHLRWRLRSWQADAHEALGEFQEGAHLYAEAAHLARGLNRAVMLQEQAALLLQLGQPGEAARVLEQARALYTGRDPEEELNLATWQYLQAQALLGQGQPDAALVAVEEAARLEARQGEHSYGVALVRGQVLTHLGRQEAALKAFEQALNLASPGDRPYANHELGVALLDLDRPVEAREKLEAVLSDPEYPYLPEVLADVAECDYRLGRLPEAQQTAEQALAQGAVIPASLVLGNVALDYYHLDEALEHYERVVREAAPESRDWVTGHQMAADVMAQQGFTDPAAAYAHAQQALAHTPESDDWYVTLQDHLRRAGELMGSSRGRTLN